MRGGEEDDGSSCEVWSVVCFLSLDPVGVGVGAGAGGRGQGAALVVCLSVALRRPQSVGCTTRKSLLASLFFSAKRAPLGLDEFSKTVNSRGFAVTYKHVVLPSCW